MASRLVRLKAQMLLPRQPDDEGWEDPRAELVRRLLEYQQIREIAIWMGRAAERRAERFARGYLPPAPELPPPPLTLDLLELLARGGAGDRRRSRRRCCTGWWRGRSTSRAPPAGSMACWPNRDADSAGSRRSATRPTIVDVLSTLLALLELAKRGSVRLRPAGAVRADGDRP